MRIKNINPIRLLCVLAVLCSAARLFATDTTAVVPAWPDAPPAQLREEVFVVKLRLMRVMSGDRRAREFIEAEMNRDPRPEVKACYAAYCLFSERWGAKDMFDPVLGRKVAAEAISEGSVMARVVLGEALAYHIGNFGDEERGLKLIHEAAALGNIDAQALLAVHQAVGWRTPQNLPEGDRLARRMAAQGQPLALLQIGWAYEQGRIGGKPDLDRAATYYAAAARYQDKQAWQGLLALEKKGVAKAALAHKVARLRDLNEGWNPVGKSVMRQEVEALAKVAGDDPETLTELARAYTLGSFAKRDYKAARALLQKAVAAGYTPARVYLAKMRLRGQGGPREPAAIDEINALAEQGQAEACSYLGWLYYWGADDVPGIKKNPELSFKYCRMGAEAGDAFAYLNLGFAYEHGIGTAENYAMAVRVFWMAVQYNYLQAREEILRLLPHVKI